jgi:hypothetical protein
MTLSSFEVVKIQNKEMFALEGPVHKLPFYLIEIPLLHVDLSISDTFQDWIKLQGNYGRYQILKSIVLILIR